MSAPANPENQPRESRDARGNIQQAIAYAINHGVPAAVLAASALLYRGEQTQSQFDPGSGSLPRQSDVFPGPTVEASQREHHRTQTFDQSHASVIHRVDRIRDAAGIAPSQRGFKGSTREAKYDNGQYAPLPSLNHQSREQTINSKKAYGLIVEGAKIAAKGISQWAGEKSIELPDEQRAAVVGHLNKIEYQLRRFGSLTTEARESLGNDVAQVLRAINSDAVDETGGFDEETRQKISWALEILVGAGVLAGTLKLASRLDKKGRMNLVVSTALLLAACGVQNVETAPPIISTEQNVFDTETPIPIEEGFTIEVASEAVKPWTEITINGTQGERASVVTPVIFVSHENSDQLITVRPVTDPSWEFTVGQAPLREASGKKLNPIKFLVGYNTSTNQEVAYALFINRSISNSTHVEYDVYELVDGQLVPASIRLVADRTGDTASMAFINRDTGVRVELVATPEPNFSGPEPTAPSPTLLDSLLAFTLTGDALAAGPEEVIASVTPTPTTTPAPTETLAPTEVPFNYIDADSQNGPEIRQKLAGMGIDTVNCEVPPGLVAEIERPNGMILTVKEHNRGLLNVLAQFTQGEQVALPDEVTTFTCRFRQDQNGVMRAEWFFTTVDNRVIFLSDDMTKFYYGELIDDVLVPTLKDGRVIVVTPPYVAPPTSQPGEQVTSVPPVQGTEAPPVVVPTIQPEQPPAVAGFNLEGNQYICRKCAWDESLINGPNIIQITLSVGDRSTGKIELVGDYLSPGQFLALVNDYVAQGYAPGFMGIWQATNIGDPSVVGVKPQSVWYFMVRD